MPPRPGRPGAGAYRPPHLRKTDGSSSMVQQRSLGELAPHNMLIELKYTKNGPLRLNDCPDNILEQHQPQVQQQQQQQGVATGHGKTPSGTNADSQLACVHLQSPACADEHQMSELLTWFAKASQVQKLPGFPFGDTSAVLCLPSSLSKYERAKWHAAAQKAGLASASKGFGEQRSLQITNKPRQQDQLTAAEDTGASNSAGSHGNRSCDITAGPARTKGTFRSTVAHQQHHHCDPDQPVARYKQVWEWCQVEGGMYWNYSQAEIMELLEQEANMPPELQQLIQKRETSTDLCEALQQGDEASALALLAAAPAGVKLGWVRDTASGGYPAHIAAFHGLGKFIKQLIATDGVEIMHQHDAHSSTPIILAQQCGHLQLAAELEQIRAQFLAGPRHTSASGSSRSTSKVPDSNCSKRGSTGRDFCPGRGIVPAAANDTAPPRAPTAANKQQVQGAPALGHLTAAAAAASYDLGAVGHVDTAASVKSHHTAECPHLQTSLNPSDCNSMDTEYSTRSATAALGSWRLGDRAGAQHRQHYCSYDVKGDRAYMLFGKNQGSSRSKGRSSTVYNEQGAGRPSASGW